MLMALVMRGRAGGSIRSIEVSLYRIDIALEEAGAMVAVLRIQLGGARADSPGYEDPPRD